MENALPKNWVSCQLKDVFDIVTGNTPPKKFPEYYGGNIPWVKPGDIMSADIIFKTEEFLTDLGFEKARKIPAGSVMVTCIGNLGNTAIAGKELATNQQINSIVIYHDLINKKYVYYNSKTFKKWLIDNSTSTTISMVNKTNFEKLPFLLPPLPEQTRIVVKLDQLYGQLELIKESLDKIPQLLKDFRQQVLTQAVTGKLTEDFNYAPIAEEIINDRHSWYQKEILLSKEQSRKKPRKIVLKVDKNRNYWDGKIKKKVDIVFFEEIAAKKDNALKAGPFGSSLKKEFYTEAGYKIYGQEQVINNDHTYGDYYIDKERYDSLLSCSVDLGDILISLVGTIGKVLIVPEGFEPGIINPRLVKLSLHEFVNPLYIKFYLQSQLIVDFLKKSSHGGTMDVLNLGIIKTLPIPLPSREEQQEIVTRVETLFAKADTIEQQYQNLKQKIDTLPQAILHKAFKGELVPQLESDGDARELLEEIKALKKQTGKNNIRVSPSTSSGQAKVEPLKKSKAYKAGDVELGRVAEESEKYK